MRRPPSESDACAEVIETNASAGPTRLILAGALAAATATGAATVVSIANADAGGAIIGAFLTVAAIAVAPTIVAELRRGAGTTLVTARAGEPLLAVGETDHMLVIDAGAGDLLIVLPQPSRVDHRQLTVERIDRSDHAVVLHPLGRTLDIADGELRLVVAEGAWTTLDSDGGPVELSRA